MSDIQMVVGDTRPPIEATLNDSSGSAINLVGSEVYFVLREEFGGKKVIDSKCEIVDAENGVVKYEWDTEDTAESGYFNGKFRVKFAANTNDSDIQHFPNNSDIEIEIDDQ